jgi:hypothetical protein
VSSGHAKIIDMQTARLMAPASKALFFILFALSSALILSPNAKAGCGSQNARGWSINLSTMAKSPTDYGTVTECQSNQGSFQSFSGKRMDFGWANCVTNCEKGFKPGNVYVRVDKIFKVGSQKRENGWKKTCVQQFGSSVMYCLESI